MKEERRTQVRLPEDVYFAVRHVAAASETSLLTGKTPNDLYGEMATPTRPPADTGESKAV